MSTIKAGYRMTVVSWENDGDNYNTITKDGLTENEVQMYVDFLSLLKGNSEFSNMYEPDDEEIEGFNQAVLPLLKKHDVVYFDGYPCDMACEIVGELTGYTEFFTRVVEEIKIEYIPVEVCFEDVTNKFIN